MPDDVQKPVGPFETFEECVGALSDEPDVDDAEAVCGWMEQNPDLANEYDPEDGGIIEFARSLQDENAEKVLTNLEVTYVSGVENPAIDSQWVYAKHADADRAGADWGVTAPIVLHSTKTVEVDGNRAPLWAAKDDAQGEEEQKAWAPVLIPNETDKQGDVIPANEIENAAHEFLSTFRNIDTDHDLLEGKGVPIESWTLKEAQTFTAPDGTESREYPAGTWMMGVQFADEAWKRVKEGELTGFSIYGEASPVDVDAIESGDVSPDAADAAASASPALALAAKSVNSNTTMPENETDPDGQEAGGDGGEGGEEPTLKEIHETMKGVSDTVDTVKDTLSDHTERLDSHTERLDTFESDLAALKEEDDEDDDDEDDDEDEEKAEESDASDDADVEAAAEQAAEKALDGLDERMDDTARSAVRDEFRALVGKSEDEELTDEDREVLRKNVFEPATSEPDTSPDEWDESDLEGLL